MKGEMDEKIRGPAFPRLHVNDADKGGPRAPPRNKMSLYEQLSISSHRFIQAASTSVHPPTQGVVKERSVFFSKNNYTHQCPDLNTPLAEIKQGKKSEESGCTAPMFINSVPNSEKTAGNKQDSRSNMSEENFAVVEKRKDSNLARSFFAPEAQKVLHDTSNEAGFRARGLERVVGLSEDSGVDLTRDDVVGIIGQKHFWKARRVIMNQQRIFAVQVFELHRLIEVQRLIAASPHLLRDDMAYLNRPIKASLGKRKQLNNPSKPILIRNKSSVENGTEHQASCSSVQTGVPPPNMRPGNSQAPSINSAYNPGTWGFNPAQLGGSGLILVMSPEGLAPKFVHK